MQGARRPVFSSGLPQPGTKTGTGVRTTRVWRRVLGVEHTVIESVELETDERGQELLVARVRVKAGAARRCSRCQRRCPGYGTSPAPRRWRGLDLSTTQVYLVSCARDPLPVSAERVEDLVGGLGPDERVGVVVPGLDPVADVGFQGLDAGMDPALEQLG